MTALSNKFAVLLKKKVDKYGAACSYIREAGASVNPETQQYVTPSTTTIGLKGLLTDYRSHEIVDGGKIRYGDKKLTVAASDLNTLSEPVPGDIISINSVRHRVIDAYGISGGDVIIGYEVQIRK